jgi:tetratricopeptide (TPR) repeat protein
MAYSVYAEAAKHFMGGLYGELARGASLAEAVAAARKMVLNQPLRPSPKGNLPLQDWLVPVLYQQETYTPFTAVVNPKSEIQNPESEIEMVDLPEEGAYGFIGRDYDILRLERAFRRNHVGLLKGMGGVGKTELVCGFARWLDETQGRTGGIFFTSFEQGAGLSQVVNQIGRVLWNDSFSQLMPEQQQAVVLEYLRTHPCLLIWDNFEPVAGFPSRNEPLLSDTERDNLKQFLKDVRGGQSWVLITSRREESWLDCNYKPLHLGGLSGQDVEELAAKILQRVRVDQRELPPEYLDLLKLLGEHPLCLRVVLPHLKIKSPTQLIEALRQGIDTFQGAEEEGTDKSLTVSLDYSFAKLSERARQHLPFLAFFCERVSAELLAYLSNEEPGNPFTQPYLAIFGENLQKHDWLGILNEALDAGILENLSRSIYKIHPVLPWYLRQRLAERHSQSAISELEIQLIDFYAGLAARHEQEMVGNAQYATTLLMIEEPNLLQNLRLAEQGQDWHSAQLILQALGELYERQGRIAEFRLLRRGILSGIGTNLTDARVHGRDAFDLWIHLRGIDANELSQYGDLDMAHQIYQEILDELMSLNDEHLSNSIAVFNHNIGYIAEQKRDFRKAAKYYEKALKFYEYVGDSYNAAYEYFHLGIVEQNLENLEKATNYYNTARIIYEDKKDLYRAAKVYYQLGRVAQDKRNIRKAISYYDLAREIHENRRHLLELAPVYHHLGMAFQKLGDFEEANNFYKKSLKICEDHKKLYLAARLYHQLGRLAHERCNAEEAINYYQKAFQIFKEQKDWYNVAKTLTAWGEILEFQQDWTEALKIYVQALVIYTVSEQDLISREDIRVEALGRMLKVLRESRFKAVWREVTGNNCPEKWLSGFQAASEDQEE